jgi:putative endonuclease
MQPTVYIVASKRNGSIYIGVTSNLIGRIWQHKQGTYDGFTKHYGINQLVYYETFTRMEDAIVREKRLKEWHRAWKLRLIEESNPEWRDLWIEVCETEGGTK